MLCLFVILCEIPLVFPETSSEWAHYLVPVVSCQLAYEGSSFAFKKILPKTNKHNRELYAIGIGTLTGWITYSHILRKHYKTERELLLGANGTLHWTGYRFVFLFVKMHW